MIRGASVLWCMLIGLLYASAQSNSLSPTQEVHKQNRFRAISPSCCPDVPCLINCPIPRSCYCSTTENKKLEEAEECRCPDHPPCLAEPCPPPVPCTCPVTQRTREFYNSNTKPLAFPRPNARMVVLKADSEDFPAAKPRTGPTGRLAKPQQSTKFIIATLPPTPAPTTAPSPPPTLAPTPAPAAASKAPAGHRKGGAKRSKRKHKKKKKKPTLADLLKGPLPEALKPPPECDEFDYAPKCVRAKQEAKQRALDAIKAKAAAKQAAAVAKIKAKLAVQMIAKQKAEAKKKQKEIARKAAKAKNHPYYKLPELPPWERILKAPPKPKLSPKQKKKQSLQDTEPPPNHVLPEPADKPQPRAKKPTTVDDIPDVPMPTLTPKEKKLEAATERLVNIVVQHDLEELKAEKSQRIARAEAAERKAAEKKQREAEELRLNPEKARQIAREKEKKKRLAEQREQQIRRDQKEDFDTRMYSRPESPDDAVIDDVVDTSDLAQKEEKEIQILHHVDSHGNLHIVKKCRCAVRRWYACDRKGQNCKMKVKQYCVTKQCKEKQKKRRLRQQRLKRAMKKAKALLRKKARERAARKKRAGRRKKKSKRKSRKRKRKISSGGIAHRKPKCTTPKCIAEQNAPKVKLPEGKTPKGFAGAKLHRLKGMCVMTGAVEVKDIRETLATFPEKCRPKHRISFITGLDGAAPARFDITASGDLSWMQGYPHAQIVSMSPFWFFPSTTKNMNSLLLRQGWNPEPDEEWMPPMWKVSGQWCYVTGRARVYGNSLTEWPERIGQLPEDCEPEDGRLVFAVSNGKSALRVDVNINGDILFVSGKRTEPFVSLDGIFFWTKMAKKAAKHELALTPPWKAAEGPYRVPSWRRLKKWCFLSGVANTTGTKHIATLDSACRPHSRQAFTVMSQNGLIRIDALKNGSLLLADGVPADGIVSFDGIRFIHDTVGEKIRRAHVRKQNWVRRKPKLGPNVAVYLYHDEEVGINITFPLPTVSRTGSQCFLSGYVAISNVNGVLLTVPKFCWPNERRVFNVHFNIIAKKTVARLDLFPSGRLRWIAGAEGSYLSLEGLTWNPDQITPQNIQLSPAWESWNNGYAPAGFLREGDFCYLSGLLRVKDNKLANWDNVVGAVGPECAPRNGKIAFEVNSHEESHILEVYPTGQLVWVTGERIHPFISLDSLMYFVGQGTNLTFAYGTPSTPDNGYRPLSIMSSTLNRAHLCVLSGSVKSVTPEDSRMRVQLRLPPPCAPHGHQELRFSVFDGSKVVNFHIKHGILFDDVTPLLKPKSPFLFSLDGIHYLIKGKPKKQAKSQVQVKFTTPANFKLVTAKQATNAALQTLGAQRAGPFCFLTGTASIAIANSEYMDLPKSCLPPGRKIFDFHAFGMNTIRVDTLADGRTMYVSGANDTSLLPFDGQILFVNDVLSEPIKLNGEWINLGMGYSNASCVCRDLICVLSGVVKTATGSPRGWANEIGLLPESCRPSDGTLFFLANHNEWTHQVRLNKAGRLTWIAGDKMEPWISLDNVAFATSSPTAISLLNNWKDIGGTYRRASMLIQNVQGAGVCFLSGWITGTGSATHIATLAQQCRPSKQILCAVSYGAKAVRLSVLPDGRLTLADGGIDGPMRISLDGVRFPLAGPPPPNVKASQVVPVATAPPSPTAPNGPVPLGKFLVAWDAAAGYWTPEYFRIGKLCVVMGVSATEKLNVVFGKLPSNCSPEKQRVFDSHSGKKQGAARVDIDKNGTIQWVSGTKEGEQVSFSGLTFVPAGVELSPLAVQDPFVSYGAPYAAAEFFKEGHVCLFSGVLKAEKAFTANKTQLVKLPDECGVKPRSGTMVFHVNNNPNSQILYLQDDGSLLWQSGPKEDSLISLDGIIFPDSAAKMYELTVKGTYKPFGEGFRDPAFTRQGELCLLVGSIRKSTTAQEDDMLTLPLYCRPKKGLIFHAPSSSTSAFVSIRISKDGVVSWVHSPAQANVRVSLDGILFVVSPDSKVAPPPKDPVLSLGLVKGQVGGLFSKDNLAREKNVKTFSSSDRVNTLNRYVIDGVYGDRNGWQPDAPMRGMHFIGISFDSKKKVRSVAFGRDNTNKMKDKVSGRYTIEYCPDIADRSTPDDRFREIGTVEFPKLDPKHAHRRHVFTFSRAVEAATIRITVTSNEIAIDEIEIYPYEFVQMTHDAFVAGGQFANNNLARADAVAFASSVFPAAVHRKEHLNDGIYGNSYSWRPKSQQTGLIFGGLAFPNKVAIQTIAFGRDNRGEYKDACDGEYILQYTTEPSPNEKTPDDRWITVGSVFGRDLNKAWLRHVYRFSDSFLANALRIVTRRGDKGDMVIDEIEAYSAVLS